MQEDYEESVSPELGLTLSPDWDLYSILEQHGILHVVAAERDGKAVGYAVTTFSRSSHYDVVVASVDALWVMREHRKNTGVGLRLVRDIERESRLRNAGMINFHFQKAGSTEKLLKLLGYVQTDVIMSKRIYGS